MPSEDRSECLGFSFVRTKTLEFLPAAAAAVVEQDPRTRSTAPEGSEHSAHGRCAVVHFNHRGPERRLALSAWEDQGRRAERQRNTSEQPDAHVNWQPLLHNVSRTCAGPCR